MVECEDELKEYNTKSRYIHETTKTHTNIKYKRSTGDSEEGGLEAGIKFDLEDLSGEAPGELIELELFYNYRYTYKPQLFVREGNDKLSRIPNKDIVNEPTSQNIEHLLKFKDFTQGLEFKVEGMYEHLEKERKGVLGDYVEHNKFVTNIIETGSKFSGVYGNISKDRLEKMIENQSDEDKIMFDDTNKFNKYGIVVYERMKAPYQIEYKYIDDKGELHLLKKKDLKEENIGSRISHTAEDIYTRDGREYILKDINTKNLLIEKNKDKNKLEFIYKEKTEEDNKVNYVIRHMYKDEDGKEKDIVSRIVLQGRLGLEVTGEGQGNFEGYDFKEVSPVNGTIELSKDKGLQEIVYEYEKNSDWDEDRIPKDPQDPKELEEKQEDVFANYYVNYLRTSNDEYIDKKDIARIGTKIKKTIDADKYKDINLTLDSDENSNSIEKEIIKEEEKEEISPKNSNNAFNFYFKAISGEYSVVFIDEEGKTIDNGELQDIAKGKENKDVNIGENLSIDVDDVIETKSGKYILNYLNRKSKIIDEDKPKNEFKFRYKKATEEDVMGNYLVKYVYKDEEDKTINIISLFVMEGRVGYEVSVENEDDSYKDVKDFTSSGFKFDRVEPSKLIIDEDEINEIVYYYEKMDPQDENYPTNPEEPKDPQDIESSDEDIFIDYRVLHVDSSNNEPVMKYSPRTYTGKKDTSIRAKRAPEEDIVNYTDKTGYTTEKDTLEAVLKDKPIDFVFKYTLELKETDYEVRFIDKDTNKPIKDNEKLKGFVGDEVQYMADTILSKDGVEYVLVGKNEQRIDSLDEDSKKNIMSFRYKKARTDENIKENEGLYLVRHVYKDEGKFVDIINPTDFVDKIGARVRGRNENSLQFDNFTFTNEIDPESIVVSENVREIKYIYKPNDDIEDIPMGPEDGEEKPINYLVRYLHNEVGIAADEEYKVNKNKEITRKGPKYIVGSNGNIYKIIDEKPITKIIKENFDRIEFDYELLDSDLDKDKGYYTVRYVNEDGEDLVDYSLLDGEAGSKLAPEQFEFENYEFVKVEPSDGHIVLEEGKVKEIKFLYKWLGGESEPDPKPEPEELVEYQIFYRFEGIKDKVSQYKNKALKGTKISIVTERDLNYEGSDYTVKDGITKRELEIKDDYNEFVFDYDLKTAGKGFFRIRYVDDNGEDILKNPEL